MNQERDDKAFERYLDGDSVESRRYAELGDERPPPELDARILADAESAVKITPLPTRRAPPFKAFAWAAIVVLSFSLVLNIVFQESPRDPVAELERMAGRSDIPTKSPEGPLRELMVSTKKAESAKTRDGAVAKDGLIAARARTPATEEEAGSGSRPAAPPQFADEVVTSEMDLYEQSAVARRTEAKPTAATVEPITANAIQVGRARTPAMQLLADYVSPPARLKQDKTLSSAAPEDDEVDAELRGILERYDEGYPEEAMTALAGFREKYPKHPLSVALADGGF